MLTLKNVTSAKIVQTPDFILKKGKEKTSSAKVRGLAYEKRVIAQLKFLYGDRAEVFPHVWIEYVAENKSGVCQPDCYMVPFDEKKPIILVEVKLSWKAVARTKMTGMYEKLLKFLYPGRKIKKVQVCSFIRRNCKDSKFISIYEMMEDKMPAYSCVHWG